MGWNRRGVNTRSAIRKDASHCCDTRHARWIHWYEAPRCLNSQIREIEGPDESDGGIPTLPVRMEGDDEVQYGEEEEFGEGDGSRVEEYASDSAEPFKGKSQMNVSSGSRYCATWDNVHVEVKFGARSSVLGPCEEKRCKVKVRIIQFGHLGDGQRRCSHCGNSTEDSSTFLPHPIFPGN